MAGLHHQLQDAWSLLERLASPPSAGMSRTSTDLGVLWSCLLLAAAPDLLCGPGRAFLPSLSCGFWVYKWQWWSYLLGVTAARLHLDSPKPTAGTPQSPPQPSAPGRKWPLSSAFTLISRCPSFAFSPIAWGQGSGGSWSILFLGDSPALSESSTKLAPSQCLCKESCSICWDSPLPPFSV